MGMARLRMIRGSCQARVHSKTSSREGDERPETGGVGPFSSTYSTCTELVVCCVFSVAGQVSLILESCCFQSNGGKNYKEYGSSALQGTELRGIILTSR